MCSLIPRSSQYRLRPFGTAFPHLTQGRAPEDSPQVGLKPAGAPGPYQPPGTGSPPSWCTPLARTVLPHQPPELGTPDQGQG